MKAVSAQEESCCVYAKLPKIMQHMHGVIPYMFDCWAIQFFISLNKRAQRPRPCNEVPKEANESKIKIPKSEKTNLNFAILASFKLLMLLLPNLVRPTSLRKFSERCSIEKIVPNGSARVSSSLVSRSAAGLGIETRSMRIGLLAFKSRRSRREVLLVF